MVANRVVVVVRGDGGSSGGWLKLWVVIMFKVLMVLMARVVSVVVVVVGKVVVVVGMVGSLAWWSWSL